MERNLKNLQKKLKKGGQKYILFKHSLIIDKDDLNMVIEAFISSIGSCKGSIEQTWDCFTHNYIIRVELSEDDWKIVKGNLSTIGSLKLDPNSSSIIFEKA